MKRIWIAGLSMLLCAALLAAAGCGGQPTPAGSADSGTMAAPPPTTTAAAVGTESAAPTRKPTAAPTQAIKPATTTRTTRTTSSRAQPVNGRGRLNGLTSVSALPAGFAQGYAQFASELTRRLYTQGENLFYSPASVYLALGMTANGASGDTAKQMLKTLGAGDLAALNAGCRDLQSLLGGNSKGYFQLANALWFDKGAGFQLKPAFVQANKSYFGAELTVSPFDAQIIPTINQWVADNTGGHIRDLLTPPLDPNAFLFLVNTLLFEGSWSVPFGESYTQEGTFHGARGDIRLPLMQRTLRDDAYWYEDELVQATTLDYADGRTAMLLALPKKDLQTVVQSLQSGTIAGWVKGMAKCARVNLTLPRFQLTYDKELSNALAAMGMSVAFRPGQADFRDMADTERDVWIQKVVHKAALEVTENGTMAAAATAVEMRAKSAKPTGEDRTLCLDRPFLCAILDKTTGAVFFLGAVNQPQALTK